MVELRCDPIHPGAAGAVAFSKVLGHPCFHAVVESLLHGGLAFRIVHVFRSRTTCTTCSTCTEVEVFGSHIRKLMVWRPHRWWYDLALLVQCGLYEGHHFALDFIGEHFVRHVRTELDNSTVARFVEVDGKAGVGCAVVPHAFDILHGGQQIDIKVNPLADQRLEDRRNHDLGVSGELAGRLEQRRPTGHVGQGEHTPTRPRQQPQYKGPGYIRIHYSLF
mmetsp:Transcript_59487/g.143591  ORF Transcript_59487/g.143591 Transcript_59487/m.143591 type:complete len:220 (-) Transcript_59487:164-823(-)